MKPEDWKEATYDEPRSEPYGDWTLIPSPIRLKTGEWIPNVVAWTRDGTNKHYFDATARFDTKDKARQMSFELAKQVIDGKIHPTLCA